MLKVIGASWVRTVASFSILIGILIFGILIIAIYSSKNPEDDGKYAATVSWNPYTENFDILLWGQNNDPRHVGRGVARAYYQPCMHETGWAVLEIESNPKYSDELQAFAAGIVEGSLSWKHIHWHWKNTVEKVCEVHGSFCDEVRQFLRNNTRNIRKKAMENDKTDPFWHQINLFYLQLEGLKYGWKYEVHRNRKQYEIPFLDFLWMNIMPDLQDFQKSANLVHNPNITHYTSAGMSVLKLLSENNRKFLLAHASSGFYSSMLRIQKKYNLSYHINKMNSSLVPGRIISFTSYPAAIHSQDDFYRIFLNDGSKIILTGTAINTELKKIKQDAEESVLLGPRVMAANRLANNGKSWANLVSKCNSGTGNKQWLHVHSQRGVVKFWVLEQIQNIIISRDETNNLYSQRYWINCGISHFKITSQLNENMEQKASTTVMNVLKNGLEKVSDVQSLIGLMRGPELALVGRTDLLDTLEPNLTSYGHISRAERSQLSNNTGRNGNTKPVINNINLNNSALKNNDFMVKYSTTLYKVFPLKSLFSLVQPPTLREVLMRNSSARRKNLQTLTADANPKYNKTLHIINGIIDLKVARDDGSYLAAAGPPFSLENKEKLVEPFQWSKSRINYLPHNGHSDVWNFQPVAANFVWD